LSCTGHEGRWEMEIMLHSYVTLTLDGNERSASPQPHTISKRIPSSHLIRDVVGTRTCLDILEKKKSHNPAVNRTPYYQSCSLVTILSIGSQSGYSVTIKDFFPADSCLFCKTRRIPRPKRCIYCKLSVVECIYVI